MLKEYETQHQLNPKLWTDDQCLPDKIRNGFLKIATKFFDFLEIDTNVNDIILIGSNANYNWTEHSDIDLHVVINYLDVGDNLYLVEKYLQAKKSIWNSKYPLTFKGMNIELYAQDLNEDLHSSVGIYSVLKAKWIRKPNADLVSIDDDLIRQKAEPYEYEINKISAKDPEAETKIKRLLVKLRNLRQAGLDAAGEYSVENLAFKYLRNKGLLDRLKEMLHAITTNQLIIDEAVVDSLAQHVTQEKTLTESDWNNIIQHVGGVKDERGQWDHPGRCTMIPSNSITMRNVPFKVLGIDDTGHMQLMHPEREYIYPGSKVFEIPHTAQWQTVIMQLLNKIQNGSKYAK
jgi:predicted nucleotidyltransferase